MTGTMCGDQRGLIPRSIDLLIRQARDLQSARWQVHIQLSVLEIYNEEVRDLLCGYPNSSATNAANNNKEKVKIFRHPQTNRVLINGLTNFDLPTPSGDDEEDAVKAFDSFQRLFDFAVQARSTAHTGE
jgi:hypothetical protein